MRDIFVNSFFQLMNIKIKTLLQAIFFKRVNLNFYLQIKINKLNVTYRIKKHLKHINGPFVFKPMCVTCISM